MYEVNNDEEYNIKKKPKLFLILIIGLFILFLILLLSNKINSNKNVYYTMETKLKESAQSYLNDNNIVLENGEDKFISFSQMKYVVDSKLNCNDNGGIRITKQDDDYLYDYFYLCDGYTNETMKKINPEEDEVSKYFFLNGDNIVFLNNDEEFQDPGYFLKDKNISVSVNNNLGKENGVYFCEYLINTLDNSYSTIRVIIVENSSYSFDNNSPIITLNGDKRITIKQNDPYEEPGYTVIDKNDGDVTKRITIKSNLDIYKEGIYTIEYSYKNTLGNETIVIRTIEVIANNQNLQIDVQKSETGYTKEDLDITIKIMGEKYAYTLLPDNIKIYQDSITYHVTVNGTYIFKIYDNEGNYQEKKVSVANIDRIAPSGTCFIGIDKSLTITGTDNDSGILSYHYLTSNGYVEYIPGTIYKVDSSTQKARIIDKLGNEGIIDCTVAKPKYDLEVHMIMMGDGDSMVIRSSNKVLVIDGGYDYRASRTVNYLKELGITKIDAYFATHYPDGDHVGAMPAIFKNFTVEKAYSPGIPPKKGGCVAINPLRNFSKQLKAGDILNFDDFKLYVVGPIKLSSGCVKGYPCTNTDSLNFVLEYQNTKFFFTGDYVQSDRVIKEYKDIMTNIVWVKQPHHGLHDYISKALINLMKPKYVFVPNGSEHMSSKMKSWYKAVGATIYNTASKSSQNLLAISNGETVTIKRNVKAKNYYRGN